MSRISLQRLLILSVLSLGACLRSGAVASENIDAFATYLAPLFEAHCTKCHGENGKVKGKVDLLSLKSVSDISADPELIRDLIDAIDFQDMPPEDEPPLSEVDRTRAVSALETLLHQSLAKADAAPVTPIRRMNRFQYHNAVKDLFGLKVEVFSLPERMCREYDDYFQPATGKMPDRVKVGIRPLGNS